MSKSPQADPAAIERMGASARAVPFTAEVDEQGRLVGLRVRMDAVAPSMPALQVRYSDFGTPVRVTKPKGRIIEAPQQMVAAMAGDRSSTSSGDGGHRSRCMQIDASLSVYGGKRVHLDEAVAAVERQGRALLVARLQPEHPHAVLPGVGDERHHQRVGDTGAAVLRAHVEPLELGGAAVLELHAADAPTTWPSTLAPSRCTPLRSSCSGVYPNISSGL
jgi:hypothetical protein